MRRVKHVLITTVAALAVGWMYATPWFAFDRVQAAVRARDPARIAAEVDFPALRTSLKTTLTAQLGPAAGAPGAGDPFAALGSAIAAAVIDPLVEAFVTPEGLATLMRGEPPQAGSGAAAGTDHDDDTEFAKGYEAFDRFVVHARRKGASGQGVDLVFARSGLVTWRLAGIRLPAA